VYRFPSRRIKVIGVTGTKGKSSTTEIINAILEEAGYRTALSNTIRYKVADQSHPNLFKMSMPGRFFIQRLIRQAVSAHCDYVILEMTSQGTLQYRHKFLHLDTFVFTNLSPEHIESHGSYEQYVAAKVRIAAELNNSKKDNRIIVVNADDAESVRFLNCDADMKVSFKITDVAPYEIGIAGIDFTLKNASTTQSLRVHSPLSGLFNLYNILAAITATRAQGVSDEIIARAITKFSGIRGRVERVEVPSAKNGTPQAFEVVVDYAHTPDSLTKLYEVFKTNYIIGILGGTGGGRDGWKRKEMGRIADTYCSDIILTDEDPYDENPDKIVADVALGITTKKPTIIMDRRQAIHEAITRARALSSDTTLNKKVSILITGKGTDPYIMGPNNTKTPWSDAAIAREELAK
jgi:UDP-N-acetylmuramoyl-L-alanyl-D-glutamate--2,6-diaminopimelate ligase